MFYTGYFRLIKSELTRVQRDSCLGWKGLVVCNAIACFNKGKTKMFYSIKLIGLHD